MSGCRLNAFGGNCRVGGVLSGDGETRKILAEYFGEPDETIWPLHPSDEHTRWCAWCGIKEEIGEALTPILTVSGDQDERAR